MGKPRDIIILLLIAVLFSPVAYFIVLLLSHNARIEFDQTPGLEKVREELRVVKPSATKDSLLAQYSKTFQALQSERGEIAREREQLQEDGRRVEMVQRELELQKDSIAKEREKLEGLVKQSDVAEDKRIKQLARVYTAMKAAEAAHIIETLDDKTSARLINSIGDERQRGKIMAAMSKDKAMRISEIMIK